MFIRKLNDCQEFVTADGAIFREFIHAKKGDFTLNYSLGHAVVKPGETTKLHKLKTSEVYYILEGRGLMYINEESQEVGPDYVIYIPPNAKQCIKNIGKTDLKFLCIVEPAWKAEDEEVF